MTEMASKSFGAIDVKADGIFVARVYVVGGPPDGDGDIVLPGAITDGHSVRLSFEEHDSMPPPLGQLRPAVGEAKLFHFGRSVVAVGQIDETPRGMKLREILLAKGFSQEWSIGWPNATVVARPPNETESKEFPDARRVFEKWEPVEISPVKRGSCGPACRTLGAKCAGEKACPCQQDKHTDAEKSAAAKRLQEEIDQDVARWQRTRRAFRL